MRKIIRIGFVDAAGALTGDMIPRVFHSLGDAQAAKRQMNGNGASRPVIIDCTDNLELPFPEDLTFGQKELAL